MAAILLDQITVGDTRVLVLDSDASGGYDAPIGSIALVPSTAKLFFKISSLDTDWTEISTASNLTEQVQDAVASALTNGSNIVFTYDDPNNQISADLTDTSVSAGVYGSAGSKTISVTVDAKGRVTAASEQDISILSTQVSDFTEASQDAVAGALNNTSNITFNYDDALNQITSDLTNTGVTSGAYGAANKSLSLTVDAKGRISSVSQQNILITASQVSDFNAATASYIGFSVAKATAVTSTASTSDFLVLPLASGSCALVKAYVSGITAAGATVAYERTAAVKNIGGTVSVVNVQSDYTSEESPLAAGNATIAVAGVAGDVAIKITGVAGQTINWKGSLQLHQPS